MYSVKTGRLAIVTGALVLTTHVSGCGAPSSNLQLTSDVYRMSPTPFGQIAGMMLGAAAQQARWEETNHQSAQCPRCSTHQWWPRDGLRNSRGLAHCNCGCDFVIAGYGA